MNEVIKVTQKPIIAYELLQQISGDVSAKIESLNIESLEPTEDNLALIKRTRADLTKDFDALENQRKMVKEIVLKDYNIFEDDYKKLISSLFKDADEKLKSLASLVDGEILTVKIDGIKEYFADVNEFDFIKFDDMGLKIIKSKSDKSIKTEIDEYIANIKMSISTIDTLPNKERVLAKFQMSRDLNRAISETNIEVQREEQIKAQQEQSRLMAENAQRQAAEQRQQQSEAIESEAMESVKQFIPEPIKDEQVYKATFSVFATKAQLSELKIFMKEKGIRYE